MLEKSSQTGRAPLREHRNDCYDTPIEAVTALCEAESLPKTIWEPACGVGNITLALRERGHIVYATDLNDRGCPDSQSGVDFLMEYNVPTVEAIVTNPPFALAEQFVLHALTLCDRVYMLLRLAFLESEKRASILDSGYLAKVLVFRNRLPMMHRSGWNGKKTSSAIPFAWFYWHRNWNKPTELHRITWK